MTACPCGDPRCSTEMPCRSRGQPVRICRLQSKPELNGLEATALAFDLASSRFVVKLSGVPTRVLLKADNLVKPYGGDMARYGGDTPLSRRWRDMGEIWRDMGASLSSV